MTFRTISALGAAFLLTAAIAPAQEKKLACSENENGRQKRVCEMRESSMAYGGTLNVDAAPNGGIRVSGWDRGDILVRAKVEAWGDTDAEARDRMLQVKVNAAGTTVKADGPKSHGSWGGNQKWSVSYELFVPRKIDLKLETVNGGINIADVRGNITFESVNGGITLARAAGRVKGETVNGGVNVDLAGSSWEGEGLDLETVNGGVTINVPAAYSASFHASTVNGGMSSEFPGASVEGKWGPKKLSQNLGSGGPPVKVETVNGGVRIKRKA